MKMKKNSLKFDGEKFPLIDSEGFRYRKSKTGLRIYDPDQR